MAQPDFPEWFDELTDQPEAVMQAVMQMDPETRIFRVALEGRAEWILEFLTHNQDGTLVNRLELEAAFDQLVSGVNDGPDEPDAG
jgi:hypothetical protein